MSQIRVLICRVDDSASDHMTELAAFDLPALDPATLQPDTCADYLLRPHAMRCMPPCPLIYLG